VQKKGKKLWKERKKGLTPPALLEMDGNGVIPKSAGQTMNLSIVGLGFRPSCRTEARDEQRNRHSQKK
jgi:hypothetical protein